MQVMPAHGMSSPADAVFERLRTYESNLERTSPPVFVGRQGVLEELQFVVRQVAETNPRGMTRIVQGVPGAGKSSLCDEFLASVQGRLCRGRRILCAKLPTKELDQPPLSLVGRLANTLPEELAQVPATGRFVSSRDPQFWRMASTILQVSRRPSLSTMHHATHGLTDASSLSACIDAYVQHLWPKDIVIVLAFDEMQKCSVTPRTISALDILNECLHNARILVVCFGLQNTKDFMREDLRLSRIAEDAVTNLGPLAPNEGRQVLDGTLDHLGLSSDNAEWIDHLGTTGFDPSAWTAWRESLVDVLDKQAEDFPQHLTAALRATCEVLRQHRDAMPGGADLLNAIADRHEENKAGYYRQALGKMLRLHRTALGGVVHAAANAPVPLPDVAAAFESGDDFGRSVDRCLAEELADLAVQRGVLTEVELDDDLHCGPPAIPSLSQHLSDRYARKLEQGDSVALTLAKRLG